MHIILIAPRWLIRLRPEISIAPCPLLPFQVLFMSSCCFHFCLGRPPRSFRPLFLLPLPLINAVLCYASRSFLITCPSHLHLLCITTVVMSRWPVHWYSSLFVIFWSQYILHIPLRQEVWKPDSLWPSLWVFLQRSVRYSSTEKTLLW